MSAGTEPRPMSFVQAALFIARQDLSYMLREKETLLWVFVMPFLFFYFIGTVTGGFGGPPDDSPDPIALVAPADDGPILAELVARLEAEGFEVEYPVSVADADRYTRRLVVPADEPAGRSLSARVAAGEQVVLEFRRRGEGIGGEHDQVRIARAVYGVVADLAVLAVDGEGASADGFRRLAAMPRTIQLEVRPAGARTRIPTGFEQTIPGTMVMFTMMILLTGGAILLVIEREQGLLRRLAATPIPRAAIVLGKWSGKMALGLVQIGFAMVVGTVAFSMDWGDALGMVFAILFAWAAFNASLGILLANLARSEAQMGGVGVLVSLVLAALGGCWWPIEITPGWMQKLALALPTGVAMDAMHRLVSFGYGAAAAMPHFMALVVAAAILGALGVRSFRYQ